MLYSKLDYLSYQLIGIMKKTLYKKKENIFYLSEFDLFKLKLNYDDSLSMMTVMDFKKILSHINLVCLMLNYENKRPPTYEEIRNRFKPNDCQSLTFKKGE